MTCKNMFEEHSLSLLSCLKSQAGNIPGITGYRSTSHQSEAIHNQPCFKKFPKPTDQLSYTRGGNWPQIIIEHVAWTQRMCTVLSMFLAPLRRQTWAGKLKWDHCVRDPEHKQQNTNALHVINDEEEAYQFHMQLFSFMYFDSTACSLGNIKYPIGKN